jgi:hypothetical protein
MAKPPTNHRKQWTAQDEANLQKLAKANTPTRVIGIKLGRTEAAIYGKASELDVSLAPTNQSPYNRRKS